jgi:thiamine pyrophosphate-dependent acetolactate synthase large subunit-like protein
MTTFRTQSPPKLRRREVVARLVRDRDDLVAISGLGSPTYDLAAAGDCERNFYLWGAMGGAAMVGLGLALARPDTPIVVFAGDGEILMGMGGFATIAVKRPANLTLCILDNELYGETGGQQTHTAHGVDLAQVARACGIVDCRRIETSEALEQLAKQIGVIGDGPTVAVIKVDGEDLPRVMPSRDGVYLKTRLRSALGLPVL